MDRLIIKPRPGFGTDVAAAGGKHRRAELWQGLVFAAAVGAAALAMIGTGAGPRPTTRPPASDALAPRPTAGRVHPADAVAGERRYKEACAACHGPAGLGQPHQGANLRDSRFVREESDEALAAFVKTGRPVGDPRSVLGLSMPPNGGSPLLDDAKVRDIVAFLRVLQSRPHERDADPTADPTTVTTDAPAGPAAVRPTAGLTSAKY